VAESISGLGAAIELADVDSPPDDLGRVLEGNIFHRAVVLGPPDHSRGGGSVVGMRARITNNGSEIADTEDLAALTGDLLSILGHTARLLQAAGAKLKEGEVVIAGSVVPAVPLRPGDEVKFELVPLLPISVNV
jgi:2-keto-4-pentenoate hydratase